MNAGMHIIGRVLDGAGQEVGVIATYQTVVALREALSGSHTEPVLAVLIPKTAETETNDEKPGRV